MTALPDWPAGTAAVLCVDGPRALPVSTALRRGDDRVLLALGRRRAALARLRERPRCVLCVLAEGLAFSAEGEGRVLRERLAAADSVVAVELHVERVLDHLADGRTELLGPSPWRWRDPEDAAAQDAVLAELRSL